MIYECSGPRFKNILNPYTGEKVLVCMSVSSAGRVRFFSPDTYTPAQSVSSPEEAYRRWNRVNGVEGMKTGRPIVCAYTGKPLVLVKDSEGCHYEGGVDLRMLMTRERFLYYATMRDGVSQYPEPVDGELRVEKPAVRGKITAGMRKHAAEMATGLSQDGIDTAERTMKELKDKFGIEGSSTVSMAIPEKKRGRKK